jgi:RNA polymerase sigma factor for flagellar operon FliA
MMTIENGQYEVQDENKLWDKYTKNNDQAIRNYFVLKYAPLVKYVARKVIRGIPQNIEFDDLVSYGYFGLFDAITKFDSGRRIKFKTYAAIRIRGAMLDGVRTMDYIPKSIRQKAKQIKIIKSELENKLGRTAEDEELAKEMRITNKEFQTLLNLLNRTSMLYLNDILYLEDDNDELSILENLEAPEDMNPDILFEKEEIIDYIIETIKKLPDKEKKVIILFYYENFSMEKIGEILGVGGSRISQIHTKAIMRLREIVTNRDLFHDYCYLH